MRRAVAVESKVKVTRENVKELINVEKAVTFSFILENRIKQENTPNSHEP